MSSTPYFSGPRVWMDSWFSLLLYSQAAPISITTRDSGSSSSLLRKRWSVSWFFSAGARNNKGFSQKRQQQNFLVREKKCPSYPGFEESLWIPGSASVVRPLEFPESSGNLKIKLIIFHDPWIQCCSTDLLVSWTPCFLALRVKFPLTILQLELSPPQTPHRSSCLSEAICPSHPMCCIERGLQDEEKIRY